MLFIDIEKSIGDFYLRVNFKTEDAVLSLLGTSGSGKSMTLKCIAWNIPLSIDEPVKAYISGEKLLFLKGSSTSPEGSNFTS